MLYYKTTAKNKICLLMNNFVKYIFSWMLKDCMKTGYMIFMIYNNIII